MVISDQVDNCWQGTICTSWVCFSGGWFWFWSARWRLLHNPGIMTCLILSPFLRVSILYVDSHCPLTSHGMQGITSSRSSVSSIFSQWLPCFPCLEPSESHAPPCALQQWRFTLSSASPTESRMGAPHCCFQLNLWASSLKTWILLSQPPLLSGSPLRASQSLQGLTSRTTAPLFMPVLQESWWLQQLPLWPFSFPVPGGVRADPLWPSFQALHSAVTSSYISVCSPDPWLQSALTHWSFQCSNTPKKRRTTLHTIYICVVVFPIGHIQDCQHPWLRKWASMILMVQSITTPVLLVLLCPHVKGCF